MPRRYTIGNRIKLGISRCLLGEHVRYDGGHKLDCYLKDVWGDFVEWIPVCPEVECGLPIPRESMRLIKFENDIRLMTNRTKIDHTERMRTWIQKKLKELKKENLCGFVFKTKSPSSGMRDIKIYSENGHPVDKGAGLFAHAFMDHFPCIPVEDERRLNDSNLRENFIERVFVYYRWQQLMGKKITLNQLIQFHTRHKYLLMSHSPKHLRELGIWLANTKNKPLEEVSGHYFSTLMNAIRLKATVRKNMYVLQHMMGHLKKMLKPDEKQKLLETIEQYHRQLVPRAVPVTLLKHYTRKYNVLFLKEQIYLNPHPVELTLQNHA